MPLWASIYILLTFVTAVDSLYDHIKYRERVYYTLLDLAADLIAIVMFVGYWYRGLIRNIGSFAPYLFLFSFLWWLCTWRHPERSPKEAFTQAQKHNLNRFGIPIIAGILHILLVAPCFIFGGIAAFRQR